MGLKRKRASKNSRYKNTPAFFLHFSVMITTYTCPRCKLDKGYTVELEAMVYGLCDRMIITRSVKAQGGRFLAQVLEEMRKNRAKLTPALGVLHAFSVDGQAVYLKLHEHSVPMINSELVVETVGTLMLGETYH